MAISNQILTGITILTSQIKLLDLFATQNKIYLVLEYAESGDLLRFVNKSYLKKVKGSNGHIEEDQAKEIFRHILAGVTHIHANDVAHRDLKCENILLSKDGIAKLSDFGFAVQHGNDADLLKTHCGSYAYAAPEILQKTPYCGKPADIWSLGVILFAMLHGCLPFKASSSREVLRSMKKTIFFKATLSSECKDMIRGLLKMRPSGRLTVKTIAIHPWLTGFDIKLGYSTKAIEDTKAQKRKTPHIKNDLETSVFCRPCKFDNPKYVSAYLQRVLRKEEAALKAQSARIEWRRTPSVNDAKAKQPRPTAEKNKVELKSKNVQGYCISSKSSGMSLKSNVPTFINVIGDILPKVKNTPGYDCYPRRKIPSQIEAVKQAQADGGEGGSEEQKPTDPYSMQLLEELERNLAKREETDRRVKAVEHIKSCFAQTAPEPLEYRIKTRNEPSSRPSSREMSNGRNRCWSRQSSQYDQEYNKLPYKVGDGDILPPTAGAYPQRPKKTRRPSSSRATTAYYSRYNNLTSPKPPNNVVTSLSPMAQSNELAAQNRYRELQIQRPRPSRRDVHSAVPERNAEIVGDLIITSLFASK